MRGSSGRPSESVQVKHVQDGSLHITSVRDMSSPASVSPPDTCVCQPDKKKDEEEPEKKNTPPPPPQFHLMMCMYCRSLYTSIWEPCRAQTGQKRCVFV